MGAVSDFDVAIVGMSCRLPKAREISDYWHNLREGVDCITRFSRDQLLDAGLAAALIDDPSYVPASAIVEDVARFDRQLWGYLPREAMLLDPQQRIFLECCWAALEDAGHAPRSAEDRPIGVFAGATMNRYLVALLRSDPDLVERFGEQAIMLTNDKDLLPMRVAFKLGLAGPCVNIQATCATSLVAVHFACRSLILGDCEIALAGGASIRVPHPVGYTYNESGTASQDGCCRPFDVSANGSVPGSGAGVVVLKRLADALADGDAIRAVIRGTGFTNDGSQKGSFTAPSVQGQKRAALEALAVAGIEADSIEYMECHGTATSLGDPIEVQALTEAFRQTTQRVGFCRLGSVKANIGHLDAAAGVSSLIKAVLALQNGLIPPTLNFTAANPELRLDETPFVIADRLLEWPAREDRLRRAGVNSIGMGGVNVHVILEEAPLTPPRRDSTGRWFLLPVSAQTPTALKASVDRLEKHLAQAEPKMLDAAWTLQNGRAELPHRTVLIFDASGTRRGVVPTTACAGAVARPATLFVFPGQGTQYAGMGRVLYGTNNAFRSAFDACADVMQVVGGPDLRRLVVEGVEGNEFWCDTALGQPALFAVEYSIAVALEEAGLKADAFIGYSLGELVAATLAGVFELSDAATLVVERGRLMRATQPGSMFLVATDAQSLAPRLPPGALIAGVLGPQRCVVASVAASLVALEACLTRDKVMFQRLAVDRPFHTPWMKPAADAFQIQVARYRLKVPSRPIYSTVNGSELSAVEATNPEYWARQIYEPVQFAQALQAIPPGQTLVAVLCGPGGALSRELRSLNGVSSVLRATPDRTDPSNLDEERQMLETIAAAWTQGIPILWGALRREGARRIPLPTYPFEGDAAWFDPRPTAYSHMPLPSAVGDPVASKQTMHFSGDVNAEISVFADRVIIRTSAGALPPTEPTLTKVAAAPELAERASVAAVVDTENRMEAMVTEIVQELFGFTEVDVRARFTELGADSLLLTQLLARLRKTVAPQLSMAQLMDSGSVRGLVGTISSSQMTAVVADEGGQQVADAASASADIESVLRHLEMLPSEQVERELARVENGR